MYCIIIQSIVYYNSVCQYATPALKGYTPLFLEIRTFYNSPRVKLLSLTFFESIQPISGSGSTTFGIA